MTHKHYNKVEKMRIIKVSILILTALLLSVSFASAVDISEFNPPKGFDEGFGESMDYDDFPLSSRIMTPISTKTCLKETISTT